MPVGNGHVRGLDLARARAQITAGNLPQPNNPLLVLTALFSVVLVTAPTLFGGGLKFELLFLVPLLLCIAWSIPRNQRGHGGGLAIATLAFYLSTVVIELIRGAHAAIGSSFSAAVGNSLAFVVIAVFGITLLTSARNPTERWWRLVAVALSPAVYVGVNAMLLQLVGEPTREFAVSQGTSAELLGLLGVSATRVQFPLSLSVNGFGAVAAAGLAAAGLLLLRTSVDRRISVLALLVCFYGVLATDSRGALLIALGILLAFALARRIKATAGMAVVVPAAPVVAVIGLGLLANSSVDIFFSRSGSESAGAGGRLQIWQGVWEVLSHPSMEQMIGYGANGQVTSGASLHYAYLFSGTPLPGVYAVQNLVLQTILDAGYIGLIALVIAVVVSGLQLEKVARRSPSSPAAALLAILAVLVLNGATEAFPSYLAPDTMTLALLAMAMGVALARVAAWPEPAAYGRAPNRPMTHSTSGVDDQPASVT